MRWSHLGRPSMGQRIQGALLMFVVIAAVTIYMGFEACTEEGTDDNQPPQIGQESDFEAFDGEDDTRGTEDLESGAGEEVDGEDRRLELGDRGGGNGDVDRGGDGAGDRKEAAGVEARAERPDGDEGRSDGSEGGEGEAGKSDSSRPEGVGPADWMAEPDDVDEETIDEKVAEGEMRRDFELSKRADRRRSIEEARQVLQRCRRRIDVGPPTSESRLAVSWRLITEGGVGTIEEPEVLHQRGGRLDEVGDCFVDALGGRQFEASGDGVDMQVQWAEEVED